MRLLPLLLTGAYGLSLPVAQVQDSPQDPNALDKRQAPPEVSQIVDATKDLTQDPAWKAIGQLFGGQNANSMDPAQKSSEAAAAQTEIQGLLTKYYSSIPNWQSIVGTATAGANQGNANPPPANGPAGGNGGNPVNGGPQQSGNNLMDQLASAQAAASRQLASASAASAAASSAQTKPPAPATAVVVPANTIPTREPDGIAGTLPGVGAQSQSQGSSSQNTAPAGNIAGTRTGLMVLPGPTSTLAPSSTGPAGNIAGTRSGLIVLQNTNTASSARPSSSSPPPASSSSSSAAAPSSGAGNIAGTRSGFVVVGNTASGSPSSGNAPSTTTKTAAAPTDATGALLQGIAGLLGGGGVAGALGQLVGGSSIATPTGGSLPTPPADGSQANHPTPGPDGVVTITITPGAMFPKATTFVNAAVPKGAAPLVAVSFAALIPLLF